MKKILLTLGTISLSVVPTTTIISCGTQENNDEKQIAPQKQSTPPVQKSDNNHVVSFNLEAENLNLVPISEHRSREWTREIRKRTNYPFTKVQQNGLISHSNETFDTEGNTWNEILEDINEISIENNSITDVFGLKNYFESREVIKMVSGMGSEEIFNENDRQGFIRYVEKEKNLVIAMGMPESMVPMMGIIKALNISFASGDLFNTMTSTDIFDYLISHKNDIAFNTPGGALKKESTPAYYQGKHIYLYNNGDKITDFSQEVPEGNLELTVKIED